jgi:hypothetical protein
MHSIPQFTAEENLNRILMDKNTNYLLVEGAFDMPIYSEVIDLLIDKHNLSGRPITVFGGGKSKIRTWLNNESPENVAVVLDRDFDDPELELSSDIITPLERYSIENYFFDKDVVVPLISLLLTRSSEDVEKLVSVELLKEHWAIKLNDLLPVIFYYQKVFLGDKDRWSNIFINREQGDWHLSEEKIEIIKLRLLADMEVDYETCKASFDEVFNTGWCPIVNFPGKILFESFRRYLKEICNDIRHGSYGSITNSKALVVNLASRLIRNREFEAILLKAIA